MTWNNLRLRCFLSLICWLLFAIIIENNNFWFWCLSSYALRRTWYRRIIIILKKAFTFLCFLRPLSDIWLKIISIFSLKRLFNIWFFSNHVFFFILHIFGISFPLWAHIPSQNSFNISFFNQLHIKKYNIPNFTFRLF